MPMKKNFTLSTTNKELNNMRKKDNGSFLGPYEETLSFIRQFARVYQYEPNLEQGLGSYVVN